MEWDACPTPPGRRRTSDQICVLDERGGHVLSAERARVPRGEGERPGHVAADDGERDRDRARHALRGAAPRRPSASAEHLGRGLQRPKEIEHRQVVRDLAHGEDLGAKVGVATRRGARGHGRRIGAHEPRSSQKGGSELLRAGRGGPPSTRCCRVGRDRTQPAHNHHPRPRTRSTPARWSGASPTAVHRRHHPAQGTQRPMARAAGA